jgi:hypothetical protein
VTPALSERDLALVDVIARRVLEMWDERQERADERRLVSASELARRLSVSRSTVYEHSAALGAIEVGDGSRPRLRFDPETAIQAWTRRSANGGSQTPISPVHTGVQRRRRMSRSGSKQRLLPVKGSEAA